MHNFCSSRGRFNQAKAPKAIGDNRKYAYVLFAQRCLSEPDMCKQLTIYAFVRAFQKFALSLTAFLHAFSDPNFQNHMFYVKINPPTLQRHPSGLRAKGPQTKREP